jgi:hypothetical protein
MAREPKRETGGSPAKTSKYDVELAQAHVELEHARNKGLTQRTLAKGVAWGTAILAFGLAVWLAKGVVHEIAGKKTIVEANLVLEGGLAVSITINVAQLSHALVRKKTIQRQRKRTDELEAGKFGIDIEID